MSKKQPTNTKPAKEENMKKEEKLVGKKKVCVMFLENKLRLRCVIISNTKRRSGTPI